MYNLVPQFQDLTEGTGLGCHENPQLKKQLKELKTEFVFGVSAVGQSGEYLKQYGFKHLATMNNWWPTHAGENRRMDFYWLKQEDAPNLPKVPERKTWGYNSQYKSLSEQLASGGCGFKLGEAPICMKEHYRYFTLMRLPVKVSPLRQVLLAKMNYKLIDTGKLASYWLNGWNPEKYTYENEYKFFGITQKLWMDRGQEWKFYEASQHKA